MKISISPNEAIRSMSPIIEYIAVVFAFLSFSSSPYALVYCIPDQTSAPTASNAQKEIATEAILSILPRTPSLSLESKFGHTHIVPAQHAVKI